MRRKTFEMKPMTAEEAALNMEMLGHEFYVFRNERDVNVVYLRHDGDYGLMSRSRPSRHWAWRPGVEVEGSEDEPGG